jgi:hypothetical protein
VSLQHGVTRLPKRRHLARSCLTGRQGLGSGHGLLPRSWERLRYATAQASLAGGGALLIVLAQLLACDVSAGRTGSGKTSISTTASYSTRSVCSERLLGSGAWRIEARHHPDDEDQ